MFYSSYNSGRKLCIRTPTGDFAQNRRLITIVSTLPRTCASIAQLGERQTEVTVDI